MTRAFIPLISHATCFLLKIPTRFSTKKLADMVSHVIATTSGTGAAATLLYTGECCIPEHLSPPPFKSPLSDDWLSPRPTQASSPYSPPIIPRNFRPSHPLEITSLASKQAKIISPDRHPEPLIVAPIRTNLQNPRPTCHGKNLHSSGHASAATPIQIRKTYPTLSIKTSIVVPFSVTPPNPHQPNPTDKIQGSKQNRSEVATPKTHLLQ
ncbi:hypothetical protein DSO57_1007568 [Entomophthora muscae]|uniref:Uncharacterized protein n=1 Tax=Entomophthora muscae TaxID=34485 RepID=A0ACC2S9C5_9FUNG|nr:hypothetical protein DSO57_1007568 [Entomophthora muscae]